MKRTITIFLFLLMNTAFIGSGRLQAQCTNCRGAQSNPHYSSSAIGINTIAGGQASFASGFEAIANGQQSTSIGNMIHADGVQAMIFGSNANSFGAGAMVLGKGFGGASGERITNNINNSLMIGFNSIYPTLFISSSPSKLKTGKVGIGNVTDPQAKLHILTEHGEHDGLFIEQVNFRHTNFYLGDKEHGISSMDGCGLVFLSAKNYIFNDGRIGINTLNPSCELDVQGRIFSRKFKLYDSELYKENIEGWVLRSDKYGNAFWTDPSVLADDDWTISGNNIYRLDGYVGIGTSGTYGYKLAVNGAIITEEVTVKISEDWPDYVFDEEYDLMPISQLEYYISEHGHLPDMPAAEALKENGLEVGKMQSLLLKKIEELTLYIIRQDKKIKTMESQ
jgi:hypothetical protein